MSTLSESTTAPPESPPTEARVRFRQPVSTGGFIDAAWWPRSRDLAAELPPLLATLWAADRNINRISYNVDAWDAAPRLLVIEGNKVRLGAFATSDAQTVRLVDAWGRERIDVVVVPPETDPDVAERALVLAGNAGGSYRADEILTQALGSPTAGKAKP